MSNSLIVSMSPHQYDQATIKRLMYDVIIALMPAFLVSLFFYGIGALIITLTAVLSCIIFEFLINKYLFKKSSTIKDGSAALTGILLAFNVPSNLPIWMLIVGSLVAIGVAKMTFGGLGNNPFNPALVGRVFMLIAFPVQMTSWPKPGENLLRVVDAVTGATPLGVMKEALKNGESVSAIMQKMGHSYLDMFVGNIGGSLGEISAAALILGGIYLLIRRVISWHIPLSMLGAMIIFSGILWLYCPDKNADPIFHILTGGAILGAFFMATDYVTSPMTQKGMLIFGFGCGIITILIRVFGAYPEGVSFAILIMNAVVPLINKYVKPKRFGEEKKNG